MCEHRPFANYSMKIDEGLIHFFFFLFFSEGQESLLRGDDIELGLK